MGANERAINLQCVAEANDRGESVAISRCGDTMNCQLNDLELDAKGHIIELAVCIKNVCPGKRIALGVTLHEADEDGNECARGMKTITIPAHNETCNQDIMVRRIRFVLPEDISLAGDSGQRNFVARTVAHYIDIDEGRSCACRR